MFEKSAMLYIYVETPLHAGSGNSVGVIDLPIQRERVTNYPIVQASGIKGKLRAEANQSPNFAANQATVIAGELTELVQEAEWQSKSQDEKQKEAERRARKKVLQVIFGPESNDNPDRHAGAFSPGDARLLLFPVRSLVGVFAWVTSRHVLERLRRDLLAAGKNTEVTVVESTTENGQEVESQVQRQWLPVGVTDPSDNTALVSNQSDVITNGKVVLEEFAFIADNTNEHVPLIAKWIADNAIPSGPEYDYFREKILNCLVILPEDAFRDFTQFATEVVTRIKINQQTKTVSPGALWSEEHLPSDTLLYAPLHATRPRTDTPLFNDPTTGEPSAERVLKGVSEDLGLERIQLGGDETVGRGMVKLRFA